MRKAVLFPAEQAAMHRMQEEPCGVARLSPAQRVLLQVAYRADDQG